MPMRHGGTAPLTTQGTTTKPGHLGRCTGLVDEDQAVWVEIRLFGEPCLALRGDVGSLLLGCVRRFF